MDYDQLLHILGLDNEAADATAARSNEIYIKDENETAEEFVKRLPPSQVLRPGDEGFIAVYVNRNNDGHENFLDRGEELMRSYEQRYINEPDEAQQTLLAEELKEKIISLAQEENFLDGRWLLFHSKDEIDDVWLKIVRSTLTGELGSNARIDRKIYQYVIRVFTKDFTDEADVRRVLEHLKDLKLVGCNIQYKCSAFSKLGIVVGNVFEIQPSIYRSEALDGHIQSLYGVKEENESAERFVARLLPSEKLLSNRGCISVFKEEGEWGGRTGGDGGGGWLVRAVGQTLLEQYKIRIENVPSRQRGSIIEELQNKLTELAVLCNYVKGRWMVHAARDEVDSLWLKTVQGTLNGTLGINAKLEKPSNYLISVITEDFSDDADVMRVLAEMRQLGFTPPFIYKSLLFSKISRFVTYAHGLKKHIHKVY